MTVGHSNSKKPRLGAGALYFPPTDAMSTSRQLHAGLAGDATYQRSTAAGVPWNLTLGFRPRQMAG
jgi:hypothetical protein